MSLLVTRNVVSGYGEMEILHDVSIDVAEGEIVTIIGPNGAGKSTLMKTIFGLLPSWEGTVTFAGDDISHLSAKEIVRRQMCYVPQRENVFPSLSVQENLEMGAYLRNDDFQAQMEEIYALFPDITDRRDTKAGKLSGGMRQMVAFGRALMLEPRMLLLDEPSAGLAPLVLEMIFDRIRAINEQGVTILMIEQKARQALEISDRGYVLVNGRNRLDGPAEELLASEEVGRAFLGS